MPQFIHSPKYLQAAFLSSAGYAMGQQTSPDSVSNGVTTSPLLLRNLMLSTDAEPTRDTITEYGGSEVRQQGFVGVSDFGSGTFQLSSRDATFESYFKGTTVDTATITGHRMVADNTNQVVVPKMMLLFTFRNDDRDDTTTPPTITPRYISRLVFAQVTKGALSVQQGGGVNPNPLSYSFVPSPAYRIHTGDLFTTTGMTVVNNSDTGITIEHTNPISFTTFTEASSPAGTFITGYRPLTDQATTSDKRLTKNGSSASITTLSTTTGVITFTAGTAGQIFILVYETNFVAI